MKGNRSTGRSLSILGRFMMLAHQLLQAGVGPGAEVLGMDSPDLAVLCGGVDALLRHGLRPRTPREGWAGLLPAHAMRTALGTCCRCTSLLSSPGALCCRPCLILALCSGWTSSHARKQPAVEQFHHSHHVCPWKRKLAGYDVNDMYAAEQEAGQLAWVEDGKGWGLEGVAALAGGRSPDVALQMWIRASLNERSLGARLTALPAARRCWRPGTAGEHVSLNGLHRHCKSHGLMRHPV